MIERAEYNRLKIGDRVELRGYLSIEQMASGYREGDIVEVTYNRGLVHQMRGGSKPARCFSRIRVRRVYYRDWWDVWRVE